MPRPIVLASLAVGACATAAPPPEAIPVHGEVPGYACQDPGDGFVGQPATSELASRILATSGAARLRWVPHGAVITMEYDESRVTVRLDPQNRVVSARCG